MTDPMDGLRSFQQAFLEKSITLRPGRWNNELHVMEDHPNGELRVTYARIGGDEVYGTVMYCIVYPVDSTPCFSVGYAVSEERRQQGIGATLLQDSMEELSREFHRVGIKDFYIEAVVGVDNVPSNKIASKNLSADPVRIVDQVSGEPAFQYLKRIIKEEKV